MANTFASARIEKPKLGRPRMGTAQERHAFMLEQSLALFMTEGVAHTSMGRIAAHCGVSTRTLYARYAHKHDLLIAAMQHMMAREVMLIEGLGDLQTQSLQVVLMNIGRFILGRVLEPKMLSFFKIGLTEVADFPEIARQMKALGPERIFQLLADIFKVYADKGELPIVNFNQAAESYCELMIAGPRNKALFGGLPDDWDQEAHVQFVVSLFLNGITGMKADHALASLRPA